MTPMEFKNMRQALGYSQSQMAQALGISDKRTISRWETGQREVTGPAQIAIKCLVNHGGVDCG